jgi:hypothetical protein
LLAVLFSASKFQYSGAVWLFFFRENDFFVLNISSAGLSYQMLQFLVCPLRCNW